jgi:hypothetical protein
MYSGTVNIKFSFFVSDDSLLESYINMISTLMLSESLGIQQQEEPVYDSN